MKNIIENSQITDVKLMQIGMCQVKQFNLCLRNGIFYFRRMVKGKRIFLSLRTSDPYLAVYLAKNLKVAMMKPYDKLTKEEQTVKEYKELFKEICLKHGSFDDSALNQADFDSESEYWLAKVQLAQKQTSDKFAEQHIKYHEIITPYSNRDRGQERMDIYCSLYPDKKMPEYKELFSKEINDILYGRYTAVNEAIPVCPTKETHTLANAWEQYCNHQYGTNNNGEEATKRNHRMETIFDNIPAKTLEEIDDKPEVLDELMKALYSLTIQTGKHKGKPYSVKTIQDMLIPFKSLIGYARTNKWIINEDILKKKLTVNSKLVSNKGLEQLPFSESDLQKIFTALKNIKNGDFSIFDNRKCEGKGKFIKFIKEYPEAFYFSALLSFYTGGRANSCITIRHRDIDIDKDIISIIKNGDDAREQHKKLKTSASERDVPIANILKQLGFMEYLKKHKKKYGNEAYIFEEAIRTKTDGYRPKTINEMFNTFLQLLGIKPDNDKNNKTFHSIRKTFYTYGAKNNIPDKALRTIAGSATKTGDVVNDYYMKPTDKQLADYVNMITYPYENCLYKDPEKTV